MLATAVKTLKHKGLAGYGEKHKPVDDCTVSRNTTVQTNTRAQKKNNRRWPIRIQAKHARVHTNLRLHGKPKHDHADEHVGEAMIAW